MQVKFTNFGIKCGNVSIPLNYLKVRTCLCKLTGDSHGQIDDFFNSYKDAITINQSSLKALECIVVLSSLEEQGASFFTDLEICLKRNPEKEINLFQAISAVTYLSNLPYNDISKLISDGKPFLVTSFKNSKKAILLLHHCGYELIVKCPTSPAFAERIYSIIKHLK